MPAPLRRSRSREALRLLVDLGRDQVSRLLLERGKGEVGGVQVRPGTAQLDSKQTVGSACGPDCCALDLLPHKLA